ncbi:hypothetical protein EBZ80_01245 [bacterium]|nr:hypothetical protein [bacterium]
MAYFGPTDLDFLRGCKKTVCSQHENGVLVYTYPLTAPVPSGLSLLRAYDFSSFTRNVPFPWNLQALEGIPSPVFPYYQVRPSF